MRCVQSPHMGCSCLLHAVKPQPKGYSTDKSGSDSAQWHRDTRRVPEQHAPGIIQRAKGS